MTSRVCTNQPRKSIWNLIRFERLRFAPSRRSRASVEEGNGLGKWMYSISIDSAETEKALFSTKVEQASRERSECGTYCEASVPISLALSTSFPEKRGCMIRE